MAYELGLCLTGESKRLIISMPPRFLKSFVTSVSFPAYALGVKPGLKIACASYSRDLSEEFSVRTGKLMETQWYQDAFQNTRFSSNTKGKIETTQHGSRFATSVEGGFTGYGGNIIIIDDPHKAHEVGSDTTRESVIDWFKNTVSSRLDNPEEDVIILVMQRLHVDDLAGFLLKSGRWRHLNLPMIAEEDEEVQIGKEMWHQRTKGELLHAEHLSMETLKERKELIESYTFAGQ